MLGDTKTRAVIHSSVVLPPDTSVKAVDITAYSHKLTANALANILEHNRKAISFKTATLIDISCKHQNYADILIQYFSKLRIVTNKSSIYRHYKDAKLYECGAAISISSRLTRQSEDNALFVSPDGIILPGMNHQMIPIITSSPISADVTAPVYHSFRAQTPQQYFDIIFQNMYLKNYDDQTDNSDEFKRHLLFLHCYQAALYEYCGIRTLGIAKPSLCILNNEVKTIEEIKVNIFSIDKN